jgi:glycosyltransferase involved in cell wall biosynthesis
LLPLVIGKTRLRVLHCPTTIGGNPQGLAIAERQVGLDSRSVAFTQNYFSYPCDEVLWPPGTSLPIQQLRCWKLLRRARRDFDVVHYNAGTTILPWKLSTRWEALGSLRSAPFLAYVKFCRNAERFWLRGKVVAVTFQGDDARQGDYCRQHFEISIAHETGSDYYTAESDETTRQRIELFNETADLIYAVNPDLLWVLPKCARFVPYAHLDITDWIPVAKETSSTPVIIHAPSHRAVKGTRHIVEAIGQLKSEGVPLEFVLVENMSNADARKLYERADLIVDQLLAGWYGGFAVEAMALGKPTICYLRRSDFVFLPEAMRAELPLIVATPADIYAVLREWLVDRRGELQVRGRMSRRYVERWHDPLRIARDLKADYERIARGKVLMGGPADPTTAG